METGDRCKIMNTRIGTLKDIYTYVETYSMRFGGVGRLNLFTLWISICLASIYSYTGEWFCLDSRWFDLFLSSLFENLFESCRAFLTDFSSLPETLVVLLFLCWFEYCITSSLSGSNTNVGSWYCGLLITFIFLFFFPIFITLLTTSLSNPNSLYHLSAGRDDTHQYIILLHRGNN
jgi:hypothetical protein